MTGAVKMFRLDLLSMQVYFKSYVVFFLYPLLFAWWEPVGMAVMAGMMLAMLGGSIFSVQEKNKLERLYGMLSISDSSLLAGRYLFLLANCLTVQLVILPLHFVVSRLIGKTPSGSELLFAMGLSYFLFWLQCSYQIPLFIKFGYTKMRIWATAPFIVIALSSVLFTYTLGDALKARGPYLEKAIYYMYINPLQPMLTLIALGTLLGAVSYLISIGAYRSTKRR